MRLKSTVLAIIATITATWMTIANAQCLTENDDFITIPKFHDITGMINFDLNLFRDIYLHSEQQRNIVLSPYSIWSSLLLAYFGSAGNTRVQMEEVMGIREKLSALKTWRILEYMYKERDIKNFAFANRLFIDSRVSLSPCLASLLMDEIQYLDFSKSLEASWNINKFLYERTFGVVSNVVQPTTLQRAVSVLANAAIFQGKWDMPFSPENTKMLAFYDSPEFRSIVPMMSLRESLRYGKSLELQAEILELPYSDGYTSMILLLPALEKTYDMGLTSLVLRLTPGRLRTSINNIWHRDVNITLPRFKFRNNLGTGLKESLARMGMVDLFTNMADLSSLAPLGGLKVSSAIHEATIEVDEDGTEASASTLFVLSSKTRNPPPPVIFECNRPFLFLVYDKRSKNILFMGAYRNATHQATS